MDACLPADLLRGPVVPYTQLLPSSGAVLALERNLLGPMWLVRSGQEAHSSVSSLRGNVRSFPFSQDLRSYMLVFAHGPFSFLLYFSSFFLSCLPQPLTRIALCGSFYCGIRKGAKDVVLFLLSRALKARVGEQYYYGCCFHFLGGIYMFVFLSVWVGGGVGGEVGGAASAGEIFI